MKENNIGTHWELKNTYLKIERSVNEWSTTRVA